MELSRSFWVEASHVLPDPLGVDCMHGHSYLITVCVETHPDNPTPLGLLSGFCDFIKADLDHKHLNDIMASPTMESIAMWVYERIQGPRPTRITVARPSIGASLDFYPDASGAAFWRAKHEYTQAEIRHMKKGLAQAWGITEIANQRLKQNGLPEVWSDLGSEKGRPQ